MSDTMARAESAAGVAGGRWRRWAARFGVAGFMFFLVKGLLWLIVPAVLAMGLF